ncbi:MAG: metal ABC transporter solute-binding protein, Zn/Mn family [Candidatus Methylacidiphilales bacterium]
MKQKSRIIMFLCLLITGGLISCQPVQRIEEPSRPLVFVSIAPLKYVAERLLDGKADVEILVGPGENPHNYQPTPQQMVRLGRASALFHLGMPFMETLAPKLAGSVPQLNVVNLAEGVDTLTFAQSLTGGAGCCPSGSVGATHDHHHHDHGHHHGDHDHADSSIDPHVWLSPRRMMDMARSLALELQLLLPDHQKEISLQLEEIIVEWTALDQELRRQLLPYQGKSIMVYHPAFGYFCHDYGLVQRSVELEGREPTPSQLAAVIAAAKESQIRVIFVQRQFPVATANAVAEAIGGRVEEMDPLAEDYAANLRRIADTLTAAFQQP